MKYAELVTELYDANAAFELEWNDTFGPEERSARARDSRGGYIDIKFIPVANSIVEVEFSRNDSYDVTGQGEASRVLATVLEAFRDYLRGYQPKILIFASKGQSRTKLYQSLINRFASSVGYQQFDINKLKPETREKISMSGSDVMVLRKTAVAESTKDSGDTMRYNNIIPEDFDKNAYDQEDYFVVRQQSERDKENNTPSKFWDQVSRHDSLGDAQQTIEKLRQQNPNDKFSYTMHRRTQGVAEGSFGSGYGSVFTLYVNTGEKPTTKTKTKKFKREDDAVLWAEDYADQHEMFPNLKMEIQDENGNIVWYLEEPQGLAEGVGNLAQALDKMSGGYWGWERDEEESRPDLDVYHFDDGEGGFYATGIIKHNLRTNKVYVKFDDRADYYGANVDQIFPNIGAALKSLSFMRPEQDTRGRSHDVLATREPVGPDDLYKSDRVGRKGALSGGAANRLKDKIRSVQGRLGPKGELPRPKPRLVYSKQDMAEAGPFSYGAKKPRKGSVADLAAKKRKEQDKGKQPIEPQDQQVGVAKIKQGVAENAEELNIGDDVIITGDVEFQGKTGMIADFGDMKRFVVVDLYNHGKHSFHSSDVSYNDYADSDDERRDSMGEGAIITKDDLVDIYIKGKGKNNMPIQKKIGAQIPNSKVESFIAAVADKYGLNPKAFVYGPSKSMSEDAAGVGVIANKKQKNDPRYSMSLTKDVRPGEDKRNMKKLHLEGNRGYSHGFASPTAPSLGRRGREDDEYHVPDPTPSTWYIRANGKIIKDKMGTPFQFRDKEAARKSAMTMMAKPFNAGKKFVLTTKPEDEQPVAEAGKGISKDAETNFHAKLDQLVHDTFGKRKSEKK